MVNKTLLGNTLGSQKHGGLCCGMSHILNFGGDGLGQVHKREDTDGDIELLKEKIAEVMDTKFETYIEDVHENSYDEADDYIEVDEDGLKNTFEHCIEVVLNDGQMLYWAKHLKELGFELHRRWFNSNSENYCNLLTWSNEVNSLGKPPYEW